MSGNNPFRIDNITNGATYNVNISLRNDFGQSGQATELYGEGKAVSAMNVSVYVYVLSDCDTISLVFFT